MKAAEGRIKSPKITFCNAANIQINSIREVVLLLSMNQYFKIAF